MWNTWMLGTWVLVGFWPTFGSDPLEVTFPLEAKGNIRFQVDAARFLEDGRPVVELVLSVPEDALLDPGDSARLVVEVESLDSEEHPLARFSTELRLPPLAENSPERAFPVPTRWVRLRPRWVEGMVALLVRLENRERDKPGLLDRLRDRHPSGEAAARLTEARQPAPPPRWLSDLLFVWAASEGSSSASAEVPGLRAVRSRLQPNPYRYYGRFQPVLTAYWERYPPPPEEGPAAGTLLVERRRILSLPDSLELSSAQETLQVPTGAGWTLRRFDLTGLRSGAYCFEVTLWAQPDPAGRLLRRIRGDFQVVWEERSWMSDENTLVAMGRVLLPSSDFEQYEKLDRGGKEDYLRRLWSRSAPTEPGRANPLEAKFHARVQYATERFRGLRAGLLSDRGRVYVRYGPADEVRVELNPQDTELLVYQLPEEMHADGEDDRVSRARLSKRRTTSDNSAYEVWEYTTRGDPLLPDYFNPGSKVALKFIFVDELGDGDFVLVYTNVPASLQ